MTIAAAQPGDWNKDDLADGHLGDADRGGRRHVQGIFAADDTMVAGAIDALKAQGIDPSRCYITSIGNTKLGNPLVSLR